jgi:hypothetical protein
MPGVLRKLIVVAAVDGLILQANGGPRFNGVSNNEASSVRIDYKTSKITALPAPAPEAFEGRDVLEAYGLVGESSQGEWLNPTQISNPQCDPGLLSVASYSFLVSITQRQQVAHIQGRPVYAVTNVTIIPTSSQEDATRAITQARKEVSQGDPDLDPSSDEEDVPDDITGGAATEIGSAPTSPSRETFHARGISVSSIAEDVIGKRLRFGRFAANWLSRKNLGLPRPGALEPEGPELPFDDTPRMSNDGSEAGDAGTEAAVPQEFGSQSDTNRPGSDQATELLPKLLRYTKLLFASHNFFFAYDYDLTRPFNAQGPLSGPLPLHKMVDPLVCFAPGVDEWQFANMGCSSISGTSIS